MREIALLAVILGVVFVMIAVYQDKLPQLVQALSNKPTP
jgi:hypothetical protein